MFDTFRNAWKIADLRKKILYTIMVIVVFRLGCAIPVPFIRPEALQSWVGETGNLLGYIDMLTGGAFARCTLFALSVTPYINASIIIQLLTVAIPALEQLAKEGEEGRKKLTRITRYVGAGIAFALAIAYYFLLRGQGALLYTEGASAWFSAVVIVLTFTAGSLLIQWLGEQIDVKGIGNGISLLIFAGIISRWSSIFTSAKNYLDLAAEGETKYYFFLPLIVVLVLAVIVFIVILNAAERRIPVQYAKRVVGRKMYGGQSTHIPIKVNMSGVMPIIFASSLISIPGTIGSFFPSLYDSTVHPVWAAILSAFQYSGWAYAVIYFLLIIGFNYFYVAIQYNPVEIANNLRNNNGTVPGYRPGKPTSDFITRVLGKITLVGALFLGVVAVMPIVLGAITGMNIALGGTSLLIVVGVALDTSRSLESYMLMRHHKGFLE
ncbi:preprotein translocase subunit SecY [uncultured Ruthenibacterium sp.]|uniref:preprotein translocase subunit SecY n=1 Tax=uncultured Ruthenibacterium sp. TaxID=1905347 RepID=UPI00349E81E7